MKTIISLLFVLIFSTGILAANFVVNNNGDTSDVNTSDNLCLDSNGNCTLRAAVEQANALGSNDVITFAAGLQTITLTSATDILIADAGTLQINGPGANVLTISGGTEFNRIFRTVNATVTVADVKLTDGGQRSINSSGITLNGAAILATGGSLTIQRAYITLNTAGSLGTVFGDTGSGAVYFDGGTHSIQNSTFTDNYAHNGGGAIYNAVGTALTIANSTLTENTANYTGGAIYNAGNLILRNATLTGNFANKAGGIFNLGYGGGVYNNNGTFEFNNTIIAGNAVQNTTTSPSVNEIYVSGTTVISTGNNFIGDSANDSINTGTPIAYQPTDIRDIPPQLAATTADNGGTTPTRALLANSPAINAGNSNAPPTDQRGAPRVGAPDIGAYEYGGLSFTISGRVTSDGTNGLSGVTVTLSGSSNASVTTNANGDYSFSELTEGGSYTVTPTFGSTVFMPQSATFSNLSGNQTANFRPQCAYSISPTNANFSAGGGSGTVSVTASAGCGWTAVSNATFITVTGGASGTGSGTVTYSVAANSGAARSGTITIAGQTFTVNQGALPTLSVSNVSLLEGNSGTTDFTFTVTLSSQSSQTVTVNYATVNGTATPPTDYQATSGTLSFAAGETSKTITILVNGDTTVEADETFTVNLSGAAGATIANAQGTGTIRNDDGPNGARNLFDFDGDGRADISVFRPSSGTWYELNTQNNSYIAFRFGQQGDKIAPGDYDGDGKADFAVFRENIPGAGNFAYFYITDSSTNTYRYVQFGATGDVPVVGDWDADGKADLAVYRDGSLTGGQSYFYYRPTSQPGVNFIQKQWGVTGDKPLVGDFDGDRKIDAAVFRPSTTQWYILRSSDGQYINPQFGAANDIPTPLDFDGDGLANIAVFRPSTGVWYTSTNQQINYGAVQFGANGDLPVAADYDGDGKADVAIYRPSNGTWYLLRSTQGYIVIQFGAAEDKPAPNAYIR